MIAPTSAEIDSIHESGHVVIGSMIGVKCKRATIEHPAHVDLSLLGFIVLMFDEDKRALFFLSGLIVQLHYYPNSEDISEKDQAVLWGLPVRRREAYTEFIQKNLADPMVRKDIETLAAQLLTDISITF